MIVDERMTSFINSYASPNSEALDELERYSIETNVPIIRKEMQSLIKFLLAMKSPKNILEVGTAIGFSAVLMADNSSKKTMITTIEKYEKRIPIAKENFKKFGLLERVKLLEGDATDILKELKGPYDFIFMDAAKGQYINFLPEILRLLSKDGILLTDNVMQEGDILESKYVVERRNRTIYKRMREYLYELTHNDMLTTVILPIGDGVTVSIRK
ncbi:MAG: O-methyltransferase [Lachnospiraceae bacterium]|nr:O-methyltransferase [Lachnospiraceae bacterium]